MQNPNHPGYYEVIFQTGHRGNEPTKNGVHITARLVEAITKSIRPQYDSAKGVFYSIEDYRIRIEAIEDSGHQYYVLDVGQNFDNIDAASFKAECQKIGSVSPDVRYCDNIPCVIADTEKAGVEQRLGTIKVYVMKNNGYGADTGKRIAGNIARAYIKAINELGDHFIVTDSETFRLL